MNDKKDQITRFVDELLSPSNLEEYQKILNKELTEEESQLVDNWIKFIQYEMQELKTTTNEE